MSRKTIFQNADTTIYYGFDHTVGEFIQITDRRYASSGKDEQGGGWVLDWDITLGFTTNLIEAAEEDLSTINNPEHLVNMVNRFAETLLSKSEPALIK